MPTHHLQQEVVTTSNCLDSRIVELNEINQIHPAGDCSVRNLGGGWESGRLHSKITVSSTQESKV